MLGISVTLHALALAAVHQPPLEFARPGAFVPLEIELVGDPAPRRAVAARHAVVSTTPTMAPASPSAETRTTDPQTGDGAHSEDPVVQARSDVAGLNNPKPAYPLAARRRGIQGRVLISSLVRADGGCAEVRLDHSSGHPLLDQSALDAVRHWRFIPARRGGVAIDSWVEVPVSFRLDSGAG
jgi:protein TonB